VFLKKIGGLSLILVLLVGLTSCTGSAPNSQNNFTSRLSAQYFSKIYLNISERRARSAVVKVSPLLSPGHGTGTYFDMFGKKVVITAKHVSQGHEKMLVVAPSGEAVVAKLIYEDALLDYSVLLVPEMVTRESILYAPIQFDPKDLIGSRLSYVGYPAQHKMFMSRGYISGYEEGYLLVNMYGWFGSSGAVLFNDLGEVVGIVTGLGSEQGQIMENIVWATPIYKIDNKALRKSVMTGKI
tara:strand:- start:1277 stop:1996 length:720 start_codon:yes stop_codon:yes gene_type:complete